MSGSMRVSDWILKSATTVVFAIACSFGVSQICAHDGVSATGDANHDQFLASPLPDRIVLTWTGDVAHSQDVCWRTASSVSKGIAEIAVAEAGPYFPKRANRVEAVSEDFQGDLGTCKYYHAKFRDLKPETKYAYRVGDGDKHWSEWFHFSTASDKPKPFRFVYFGDAQNDIRSLWSRVIREAHKDAPRAAFFLHAGDLINNADSDVEWGEWCQSGGFLNAMTPSIPTPGNHEYTQDAQGRMVLSKHWRPQFALPQHGPSGLEETTYYLDYQGVRIVSLNSNEKIVEQVTWLQSILADNPNKWTIVTFHHPIYSSGKGRDNQELRDRWKPVFDRRKVDLVLQGHDHTYARTGQNVPENVATGENTITTEGTVYVVSVSGPKMYDLQVGDYVKRAAAGLQLYQIIEINGNELIYEARTATGEKYDGFTLRKQIGKVNELIEQTPDTPPQLTLEQ